MRRSRTCKVSESIPLKAQAPNQNALVGALGELARNVRESLGRSDANDLGATGAKPSSQSLPALRVYNEGLALRRQGKHSDALKKFEESTKEDSEFALAYARLAEAYKTLGYDNEADQASRRASALSEALPPQGEVLHPRGPRAHPRRRSGRRLSRTRICSRRRRKISKRVSSWRGCTRTPEGWTRHATTTFACLKDDPKEVNTLLAAGRVEVRRREPQAALEYLNQALTLAIQFDNSEARGNILNAMGIAYRRLNKSDEALRYYKEALEIRRRLGQKGGVAASLSEIAQINATMGQPAEALKNYNEALALRREIGDTQGIGNTLLNLGNLHHDRGEYGDALKLYRESLQFQREVGNKTYEAVAAQQHRRRVLQPGSVTRMRGPTSSARSRCVKN